MNSHPIPGPGRPPKFVTDQDGNPIIGLCRELRSGRYYARESKGSRKRVTFGRDFNQALFKFRRWKSQQEGRIVELRLEGTEEQYRARAKAMRGNQYFDPWVFLPKDALHAWARDELLSSARDFAASVGIPELARLEDLKPPDPSPTLSSIVKLYVEKSAASRHERQKAERYIREFRRFAKGQTLADITQAQVADYFDWVMSSANSVTWKRHRLGKIKTVLNFAIKRGVSPEEVERVLRLCRILVMPKRTSGDPSPIDPDQFAALLDSADEKWRAILLVALNCCMYAREVESLDRSDVDLDKGVVVTSRSKTGVTRVAVLWRRTIAALRKLPVEKNEALFVGAAGTRYRADHLRRGFDRLRKKANVPNQVKFSDLRDGAYTAAVEGGADLTHAKLLAGHATGITDYYVRRNPNMVVSACAAIEAHYFCQEPC